jgi:amino acid adenylation domain-containing protein
MKNLLTPSGVRTYNGAVQSLKITPQIYSELQTIAEAENTNVAVILLVILQILLHRYTQEEDIIIGLQTQLHDIVDSNIIGKLSNVLPLRLSIQGWESSQDLIIKSQEVWNNALKHNEYTFSLLAQELEPNVNFTHSPICQVTFAYQELQKLTNVEKFNQSSSCNYSEILLQRAEFDLSLEVLALDDSAVCNFKYNSDLFDSSEISRFMGHFQNLLTAIIANSQIPVTKLSLLSNEEREQLLFSWNDTKIDYNLSLCLHEMFEAQVAKNGNAVAVKFADTQLTYSELNSRANQLAYYLQYLGIQPDDLVGICIERSFDMVVGLLGILKAGGAYVPIDPDYPQERITYMLEDSQVSVLLTQSKLIESLFCEQKGLRKLICLDTDWKKIASTNDSNPKSLVKPENLAYVIYTSGSTGKPKGVMNTNRGICNRLLWMQDAYSLKSDDSVLQKTPFSFDVSVWEFFWTLTTGARLVIALPGGHRDSIYLTNIISEENITTLHFVPSMLQVFLENKSLTQQCQSLRRVICSGEALSMDLQERFFTRLNCELHNLYGPTEAAIDVTFWQCQPQAKSLYKYHTVPIGRPIANTQIYVLDKYLQPVPIGVAGELYIGGIGVARGYFNRLDLTAERFTDNPFTEGRMYKTGDVARFLADGNIEYIGRCDHQVKLRGFRIELGEIEAILVQQPLLREAVVVIQRDCEGNQYLVAYVVPHKIQPLANDLRDFLRVKLPEFMLPTVFNIVDSIPLTPSGKVDRKALSQIEFAVKKIGENIILPRNDLERQISETWCEILHLTEVGVRDNFFELGGTSLKAISLMSAIAEKFGRELPLATLFTHGTIEQLGEILLSATSTYTNSPLVAIQPKGNKRPFFCVHPAGGHVLCYFTLARYLGTEQPFYGLQARGFYGDEEPLTTVEEMAAIYVEAIQTVQPEGPYQVGGWSFGGVVAYEVAQQLQRQGHEISLLAILDSYVPILLDKNKNIDNKYLVGVLSRVFGGMFGEDNLVSPTEMEHLSIEERLNYIIDKAREAKIFPPGVERQDNRRILDVLVGTLKATYSYQRQPYPGKVTVFRAKEKHIMAPDPTMVWVELFSVLAAGDVEIHLVPGHHYSFVLEPNVAALAENLGKCLEI